MKYMIQIWKYKNPNHKLFFSTKMDWNLQTWRQTKQA